MSDVFDKDIKVAKDQIEVLRQQICNLENKIETLKKQPYDVRLSHVIAETYTHGYVSYDEFKDAENCVEEARDFLKVLRAVTDSIPLTEDESYEFAKKLLGTL